MFRTLIRRELQGHFSSMRFHVCLAAIVLVVIMSVFARGREHALRMEEYREAVSAQEEFLDQYAHFNRLNPMIQPIMAPARLGVLFGRDDGTMGSGTMYDDPLGRLFAPVDLIFIVAILLSLFAMILSYDSVCGERETGTLRLLLSYPVSRAKVLLAKVLGGLVSLGLAFLVALVAGIAVAWLRGIVSWRPVDWLAIGLITVATLVYVEAFFALGVLISASTRSSANSVFACLLAWVVLVLLVPVVAPSLVERVYPVESANVIDVRTRQLEQQRQQELRTIRGELETRGLSDEDLASAFDAEVVRVNASYREQTDKVQEPYEARVAVQSGLSWLLASTSPYTNFVAFAASASGTGLERQNSFARQSGQFRRGFREFAKPRIEAVRAMYPLDYHDRRIDLTGRPVFVHQEPILQERLIPWGLVNLAVLGAFSVLFFVVAFVRFIRYDAR